VGEDRCDGEDVDELDFVLCLVLPLLSSENFFSTFSPVLQSLHHSQESREDVSCDVSTDERSVVLVGDLEETMKGFEIDPGREVDDGGGLDEGKEESEGVALLLKLDGEKVVDPVSLFADQKGILKDWRGDGEVDLSSREGHPVRAHEDDVRLSGLGEVGMVSHGSGVVVAWGDGCSSSFPRGRGRGSGGRWSHVRGKLREGWAMKEEIQVRSVRFTHKTDIIRCPSEVGLPLIGSEAKRKGRRWWKEEKLG